MKQSQVCPKCGTKDVVPNVEIMDKTDGAAQALELVRYGKPDA